MPCHNTTRKVQIMRRSRWRLQRVRDMASEPRMRQAPRKQPPVCVCVCVCVCGPEALRLALVCTRRGRCPKRPHISRVRAQRDIHPQATLTTILNARASIVII